MKLSEALAVGVEEPLLRRVAQGRRSPATLEQQRWVIKHLVEKFGDVPVADFAGPAGYQRLKWYVTTEENAGLSGHTIAKRLGTLSLGMGEARRMGVLHPWPEWPEVDGASGTPRTAWLTRDEYLRLRGQFERLPHRRLWIDVCLFTAMHSSDVEAMHWSHFKVEGELLLWLRHNTKNSAEPIWLKAPRGLREAISAWEGPREGLVVGRWDRASRDIQRACCRAGIDKVIAPIDLRRTFATWWREKGGEKDALKRYLGHSSRSRMVDEVYDAISPARVAAGVDLLDS